MPAFRYATQEAENIKKAQVESTRQGFVNAAIARRKAFDADAALTKTSIGLGNVDNTSDASKPVSTAQQTALNAKLNTWASVPANASATGTAGQIAYDSSYIYICTATNTWRRAALSTW